MKELLDFLNKIHPLTPEAISYLSKVLTTRELRKNTYWLKENEVCDKIAFIERGLVKVYFECGDKECVIWYNKENDIILSVKSFFDQIPSNLIIKAIEPTTVHYISYKDLQHLFGNQPDFNVNGRKVLEKYYGQCEEHLIMIAKPPKERYQDLVTLHPWMKDTRRIKDYMLASYLNIDRTTLSRYRNGK
jgi:CRP-like cAMP-binding protein